MFYHLNILISQSLFQAISMGSWRRTFIDEIELDVSDPEFNGQNLTNRVLYSQETFENESRQEKKILTYYLPAYVWIKVKNFTNLSIENLQAQINTNLIIALNMKKMPQILKEYVKQHVKINFNRNQGINIGDKGEIGITRKEIQKDIEFFKLRKILKAGMHAQVQYAPFEKLNLLLSVNLQEIALESQKVQDLLEKWQQRILDMYTIGQNQASIESLQEEVNMLEKYHTIFVKFNMMDVDRSKFNNISYTDEGTFGEYDLAENLIQAEYNNSDFPLYFIDQQTNHKIIDKQRKQVEEFSHAHFIIPLYKFPMVSIISIFIPLFLLSVLNFGVFFQDTGLSDRLNTMAGLLIAFVAFIRVIRASLPSTATVTLAEKLVYLQSLSIIWCFIESVRVREEEQYDFIWYQNPLCWLYFVQSGLSYLLISLWCIKYCCQKGSYNKRIEEESTDYFREKSYLIWRNKKCDQQFYQKLDNQTIKILK